ncbi:MAG: type II secretion system protein [Candidatus Pacebacteria bacterium]|nr:type II secretion system protein [Candidatus Paceibacterota bacterium]
MQKINTKKGFTLIELMVVVSIIALLSAIVVAGLTDAKGGAKNSKRNELARQYVIALGLYFGEHGNYPGDSTDMVCLGTGYPGNSCYILGSHNQNVNINNAISEFAPGTPPSLDKTVSGGNEFFGIEYNCTDTSCENYEMRWIVEGNGNAANCFGGATKTFINLSQTLATCTFATEEI